MIGGSPCTHWSIAQSKNRETVAEGIGWELFKNYLIAKEKFEPDFFLYENNKSVAQAIKNQISEELCHPLQYINSSLVSAQSRQRFYVHNFEGVQQPEDRGVLFRDVLESSTEIMDDKSERFNYLSEKEMHYICRKTASGSRFDYGYTHYANQDKSKCLLANLYRGVPYNVLIEKFDINEKQRPAYTVRDGIITINGFLYQIKLPDGFYTMRKLTTTECCRLQTMPDDYCRVVSKTQAYKALGNGWTAEVIMHILRHANIPLDEKIVVLSMYDGIGTGRYCFDKLGYKNVTYYAYEIDKYPIQIAMSNYPDIIQCGDAFQVREDGWSLKAMV